MGAMRLASTTQAEVSSVRLLTTCSVDIPSNGDRSCIYLTHVETLFQASGKRLRDVDIG